MYSTVCGGVLLLEMAAPKGLRAAFGGMGGMALVGRIVDGWRPELPPLLTKESAPGAFTRDAFPKDSGPAEEGKDDDAELRVRKCLAFEPWDERVTVLAKVSEHLQHNLVATAMSPTISTGDLTWLKAKACALATLKMRLRAPVRVISTTRA